MATVEEIIVKKAVEHVWQNPKKDNQCIIELKRLSPRNGFFDYGKVGFETVECPTKKGYYHFYQLGDNYPGDFNLMGHKDQWYSMADWCNVSDLVVHCYSRHGKMYPISNVFVIRLHNDNLILGVLRNDNVFDLNEETLYIHFYLNAFYTTKLKDKQSNQIEYIASTQTTKRSNQWLIDYHRSRGDNRPVAVFHNGYLSDGLDSSDLNLNDISEFYYDMSIRDVVDIPVKSLRTYKSTMDEKTKYLIHPPKDNYPYVTYRDDIDIYVCKWLNKGKTKLKGLYYHRNMEDAIRMVTHRDYALPVPYVMSYIEQLDDHPDLDQYFIRLYLRKNGEPKTLIEDCNNIKALYQLDDDKIVEAMAMVDSTVPEWQADHLESSPYTAVMRSQYREITPNLALDALGYSSIVRSLANPNQTIIEDVNGNYFRLPEGLIKASTIFEYSTDGLLLGWYTQTDMQKYYPRNKECVYIEALAGIGGDDLTINVGNKPFDLHADTSYRFYLASTENEKVVGNWKDATTDPRILITGTRCTFNHEIPGEMGIALGDDVFVCYDQYLDGEDGIFDYTLTYGVGHTNPLVIPPANIDIWMNGHALVEDIDYFIDFPQVIITTKSYIQENGRQKVTTRCTGFPFMDNGTLKRVRDREIGFVKYGKVSVNNHYDLHEDKILRITVGGGCFHPDVIPFEDNGIAEVGKYFEEGQPYSVQTPYIALKGSMNVSLYISQIKDYDLSKRIGRYITQHMPQPAHVDPPVIPKLYQVYSPFLSKITMDLKYGRLQSPPKNTPPMTIEKIIQRYKKYLTLDPVIRGYDKDFVIVHPHNQFNTVELTPRDVEFLKKLNELYLNNKVDLSVFYRVRKGKD